MSGRNTPWTNPSSLPSDRIKPSYTNTDSGKEKGKGKQKGPPKSAEVKKFEATIEGLKGLFAKDKDPLGGCFCLARVHELSPYTPICHKCGLILCTLNLPYHLCPHCGNPLISRTQRDVMIDQIEVKITETILKEEEAAIRAQEEARIAAGAFPVLAPSAGGNPNNGRPSPVSHPAPNVPHKVLSLSSKSKKAVLTTYNPKPPPVVGTPSVTKKEPKPIRVPAPPAEVDHVKLGPNVQLDPNRPWANLRRDRPVLEYVPLKNIQSRNEKPSQPKKTGNKKAKGKQTDNLEGKSDAKDTTTVSAG